MWIFNSPNKLMKTSWLLLIFSGENAMLRLSAIRLSLYFNTIDAKIKTNSDGTCTLTVQINDFLKDESGQSASVSVKVDAKDNAKTVTQKVAEKAADSAASKVVEKSGLTGEAAGIANSMAQEALRKGLGSAGSGQGTESSGTVTAPTYDPSQDSGESDDFDWSQIQSEFDSLKDEFPS